MVVSITGHLDGRTPDRTAEGHLRLTAELAWLVEGDDNLVLQIEAALVPFCVRVGRALLLRFGNAVGSFDAGPLGRLSVHSGKWDECHFDMMLSDITARMAVLPFAAGTGAALPYDRTISADHRVLYHAFVYLRHLCSPSAPLEDRLMPALRLVLAQPHRRFERVHCRVPLHAAQRVEPRALLGMVTPSAGLTRVPRLAKNPLAVALRGYLPTDVDETRVQATFDVPENQFVKAFLREAVGIVEAMRVVAVEQGPGHLRRRIEADCDAIAAALTPIVRHAFWGDVSEMRRVPAESQVLQRRRGYREILRYFVRLRLAARLPLPSEAIVGLLEIKDIAELYEMWTFFEVERQLTRAVGRPPVEVDIATIDELGARLGWGLRAGWEGGIELFYNLTFSRSHAHRRSYSVPLRPDITLRIPDGACAGDHLFDAKFKVRGIDDAMQTADPSDDAVEAAERRGVFKHADLYKVHAYRDAIPSACTVWILYPGTELRFFDEVHGRIDRLADLPLQPAGVGALPLQPAAITADLERVLHRLASGTTLVR